MRPPRSTRTVNLFPSTPLFRSHFGTDHAVADIAHLHDRAAFDRRVETWPTAAGIELGLRIEQWLVAADAVVHAVSPGVVILTGKRPLGALQPTDVVRSEEHTSELQSLMRISYAVLCLKKK